MRYEKIEMAGEGGLAIVWKARDTTTDEIVALKEIREGVNFSHERFLHEVQTMAMLDHPNIVTVRDYGIETQPFMVLDWVQNGTLRAYPVLSFSVLRDALLQILDALAHAHARGVIHRDLKPDNVLISRFQPLGCLLADFGIAHAIDQSTSKQEPTASGTPLYMSPEQFQNRWRTFGPPTDLYAIGCIAFEIASGRPPFVGRSVVDLANQHLNEPVGVLKPRFAVPEQFESWVHVLLEKSPRDRYQFAADAAYALAKMVDEVDDVSETASLRALTTLADVLGAAAEPTVLLNEVIPTTADWDAERDFTGPAYSAVWTMKRPITVGRASAQQTLWSRLENLNGFTKFVITGDDGVGKTHLLRWFGERVHETGRASVHWADGRSHSLGILGQVLRSEFRSWRLSPQEIRETVERELPADVEDRERVVAAIVGIITHGFADVGLSRMKLIEYALRVLVHDARDRPVVLAVDDAKPESIEGLTEVLRNRFSYANIVLACTHRDARGFEATEEIPIFPFSSEQRDAFLQVNGFSEKSVEGRLAFHKASSPFDVVQTVASFLESDDVEVRDVLKTRVQTFCDSFEDASDVRHLLDHFATYSDNIPTSVLHRFADALGIAVPVNFVERLVYRGFAQRTEIGFAFANPKYREGFSTDKPMVHAKCAEVLMLNAALDADDYLRLAEHFEKAHDIDRAASALRKAHDDLIQRGRAREVTALFERREALLNQITDPEERAHYLAQRASFSAMSGARERRFARALLALGDRHFFTTAHLYLACEKIVDDEDPLPDFQAAISHHAFCESGKVVADLYWFYGAYLNEIGQLNNARAAFEKIPDDASPGQLQQKFNGLAMCDVQSLDFDGAERWLDRSERCHVVQAFHTRDEGTQEHNRGMLRIAQRRFDEAEEIIESTIAIWEKTGIVSNKKLIFGLRAMCALFADDVATAKQSLEVSRPLAVFFPSHNAAHTLMDIWLLAKEQKYDEASRLWEELAGRLPGAIHQHTITLTLWDGVLREFADFLPADFSATFARLMEVRKADESVRPFSPTC